MKSRQVLKTIIVILCALLTAELIFIGVMHFTGKDQEVFLQTEPSTGVTTTAPTTEETVPTTLETTTAPTETTEPTETEPTEQRYVLTFVGDCTLGSEPNLFASQHSFVGTVGTDYDYPFKNVAEYFESDDFTMINLEGVFADKGTAQNKQFTFRGPTAYTQILTGSSVEAVTLANNHSKDFGTDGYNTTKEVLEEAGVAYVEENKTTVFTTESGLTIGLYADSFQLSTGDIQANVKKLRDAGAEIIICAFHWGTEGSYRPSVSQQSFAKAAIDAGADIVYGHHPHVLQKIEEYNDGIIYYSLGNFSFGGNHFPRDYDSAILQQEIIRDEDGTVSLGELNIIPVSISSMKGQNNFQPTPYAEGSAEYDRVISKLDGTFKGADLVVTYPQSTTTATTAPPETTQPAATTTPTESTKPAATESTEAVEGTGSAESSQPAETKPAGTESTSTTEPAGTKATENTRPAATEAPAPTTGSTGAPEQSGSEDSEES